MKSLRWIAIAVFMLGIASVAMATDGIILGNANTPGGDPGEPLNSLQDEWNAPEPHFPVGTYSGGCFGWEYTAPHEYLLERVEFLAGGVSGQTFVQVRSGDLNGPILGEVTYNEVATTGWQGENLVPAVPVTPGTPVFVIYNSIANGDASTAASGVFYPYRWAADCSGYGDIFEIAWKVRFYGAQATPVDAGTWGQIKNLYN